MATPNTVASNEAMTSCVMFENEAGTTTKPPKSKNYLKIIEYNLTRPIEQGPHVPTNTTPDGDTPKAVDDYDDADNRMLVEDNKAFGVLSVCLSREIALTLRDYTTSKTLWDALVNKFEGNLEMRNSRKGMLKGEFNMFNYVHGETIASLISKFETLITKINSAGNEYEQIEINDKILNSLPYSGVAVS
ncbi:uncharacterized protein LOC143567515 [Bidens hawaiensis]|uniref:uncharacterized protein LOC143567515 n=1 Tax=Bidens hawaiensis TaxID=980011 RepID=UPI0040490B00